MLFERLTTAASPQLASWIEAHRAGVRRAVARLYVATPSEGPMLTASGVTYGQPGHYNRGDMVMIEVPTAALDRAWIAGDASNRIGPGGAPNQIGDRYERFRRHLLLTGNGATMPIHPSTVAPSGPGVSFGDGRHRFSVLRDAGTPTVVISVHKKDAAKMKKLLAAPVVFLNRITMGEINDVVDLTIDGVRWVWRFPTLANGSRPYLDIGPSAPDKAAQARSLKLARQFQDAHDANPASLPGYRYFTLARPYAGRPTGGRVEERHGTTMRKTGAAGTVTYNDLVVFDVKPDDAEVYAAQLMPMAPDGGPVAASLADWAESLDAKPARPIALPADVEPDDLLDVNDGACVFTVKTIKAIGGPFRVVTGTETGYSEPKRVALSIGPKHATIEYWSDFEEGYVKKPVTSLRVVGGDE